MEKYFSGKYDRLTLDRLWRKKAPLPYELVKTSFVEEISSEMGDEFETDVPLSGSHRGWGTGDGEGVPGCEIEYAI